MSSRNHSYIQVNLVLALARLGRFTLFTELSLDIGGVEYKPDVVLYPPGMQPDDFSEDILRMSEMPLCAIEILSPRQFVESITDKIKVYFQAGITSCWLVMPAMHIVMVYHDSKTAVPFHTGDIIDQKLDIRLPLKAVFQQTPQRAQATSIN